jgi:hypothetical protein
MTATQMAKVANNAEPALSTGRGICILFAFWAQGSRASESDRYTT